MFFFVDVVFVVMFFLCVFLGAVCVCFFVVIVFFCGADVVVRFDFGGSFMLFYLVYALVFL